MILLELRKKSIHELNHELSCLLREYFNLLMRVKSGQIKKTHLIKNIRRNIARVKTLITEKRSFNV